MARIKYRRPKLISIRNPNTYEIDDNLLLSGLFYGGFQSPTSLLLEYYGYKRKKKIEKYVFIYQLLLSYGVYCVRVLRSTKVVRQFIKVRTNRYLLRVVFSLMRRQLYKMYRRVLLIIWGNAWLPRSLRRLLFSLMSRKRMRLRRFYKIRKIFKKWLVETSNQLSFLTPVKGVDFESPMLPSLGVSNLNISRESFATYICFLILSVFRNMSVFNFYLQKANWFNKFVKVLVFIYKHRRSNGSSRLNSFKCSLFRRGYSNPVDDIHVSSVGLLYLEQQLHAFLYNILAFTTSGKCVMVPFLAPTIYKYWWGHVNGRVHA